MTFTVQPDIENEGTPTFRIKFQLLHFQLSASGAKKSNDFFRFISESMAHYSLIWSLRFSTAILFSLPDTYS